MRREPVLRQRTLTRFLIRLAGQQTIATAPVLAKAREGRHNPSRQRELPVNFIGVFRGPEARYKWRLPAGEIGSVLIVSGLQPSIGLAPITGS